MVKFLKLPMDGGIGPVRLLVANSRSFNDLNNPISWGIEPNSLFVWSYKVVKFLMLPMERGIGPVRLLVDNWKSLRDL